MKKVKNSSVAKKEKSAMRKNKEGKVEGRGFWIICVKRRKISEKDGIQQLHMKRIDSRLFMKT